MRLIDFLFIRHGQTDANAQGLMCGGDWDVPLNEVGREQARTARDLIKSLQPELKTICVSPMKRALETAEIINEAFSAKLECIENLREWKVGPWDRRPWGEVPDPFTTGEDPEGAESRVDFEKRVVAGFSEALRHAGPLLVVAHGGVWHAIAGPLGVDRGYLKNATPVRIELRLEGLTAKWLMQPLGESLCES